MKKKREAALLEYEIKRSVTETGKYNFIFFVSDLYADEYAILKIKLDFFVMIK